MGCEKLRCHNPEVILPDGELPAPSRIIDQANRLREIRMNLPSLELVNISAGLVEARDFSEQKKVAVLTK